MRPDEEGFEALYARMLAVGWRGRSETPITASLPSPTIIESYINNNLVYVHLAKASSSSFTSAVCGPLFTRPLSFVPKSTIRFLIHAPWMTGLLLTVPAVGLLHTNASFRCMFMASSVLR
ncbi:uncharacterized protein ARMOST_17683 [Armillaria ostoyae]|uniref:Uncharacterized protein n=1 Tax=Armillaria ostoyae TaxID=47428 RepID=A0A284RZT5_ARMOS|nr:uncharacterized protein ARMOST_17683 [Armillaria ostoyae]